MRCITNNHFSSLCTMDVWTARPQFSISCVDHNTKLRATQGSFSDSSLETVRRVPRDMWD